MGIVCVYRLHGGHTVIFAVLALGAFHAFSYASRNANFKTESQLHHTMKAGDAVAAPVIILLVPAPIPYNPYTPPIQYTIQRDCDIWKDSRSLGDITFPGAKNAALHAFHKVIRQCLPVPFSVDEGLAVSGVKGTWTLEFKSHWNLQSCDIQQSAH